MSTGIDRRALALALASSLSAARIARTQAAWPAGRSIRLVVPFAAGGATDIIARIMADKLERMWGATIVIDNRGGAGANIGNEIVARAEPNGETFVMASPGMTTNPFLYKHLSYDPLVDFAPVSIVAMVPNMLVASPHLQVKTVADVIAYGKANPGKLTFASSGVGTSIHLAGELFKSLTGVEMVHVAYRGSAPAIQDLIGGRVDIMFDNISSSLEQVRAGALKGIAITTLKRSPFAPELPPVADTVPGFDVSAWFGFSAPAKTPDVIVAKFAADTKIALADPDVKSKLEKLAAEPIGSTPAEMAAFLRKETDTWGRVIKTAGVVVE